MDPNPQLDWGMQDPGGFVLCLIVLIPFSIAMGLLLNQYGSNLIIYQKIYSKLRDWLNDENNDKKLGL